MKDAIRSEPCSSCPYRQDVPSGLWAAHEYEKLRGYDEPTGAQPIAAFACHATPEHFCHGWAVVHSNRGHAYELLALRLRRYDTRNVPVSRTVALWSSGNEAADWGQRDVENPTDEAVERVAKLMAKYPRLGAE